MPTGAEAAANLVTLHSSPRVYRLGQKQPTWSPCTPPPGKFTGWGRSSQPGHLTLLPPGGLQVGAEAANMMCHVQLSVIPPQPAVAAKDKSAATARPPPKGGLYSARLSAVISKLSLEDAIELHTFALLEALLCEITWPASLSGVHSFIVANCKFDPNT
jgi:hypothetical protein